MYGESDDESRGRRRLDHGARKCKLLILPPTSLMVLIGDKKNANSNLSIGERILCQIFSRLIFLKLTLGFSNTNNFVLREVWDVIRRENCPDKHDNEKICEEKGGEERSSLDFI